MKKRGCYPANCGVYRTVRIRSGSNRVSNFSQNLKAMIDSYLRRKLMSEYPYGYVVRVGDKTYNVLVRPIGEGRFKVLVENTELDVFVEGGQTIVKPQPSVATVSSVEPKTPTTDKAKPPSDGGSRRPETSSETAPAAITPAATPTAPVTAVGGATIASPIPGKVLKVLVSPGELVNPGKLVATLESMKMEVEIFSDKSGKVKEVRVRPGDFVNVGDPLILLD